MDVISKILKWGGKIIINGHWEHKSKTTPSPSIIRIGLGLGIPSDFVMKFSMVISIKQSTKKVTDVAYWTFVTIRLYFVTQFLNIRKKRWNTFLAQGLKILTGCSDFPR